MKVCEPALCVFRAVITAGISFVILLGAARAESGDPCALVEAAREAIERVRGEEVGGAVSCRLRSRSEIGAYVRALIAKQLEPQELCHEGIILRALGMFPLEFAYEEAIHKIYEHALGGYYDPEEQELVLADWNPQSVHKGVVAHELVHALQDQRFDLRRFVDLKLLSGDEMLARMALVEGEATVVALDVEEEISSRNHWVTRGDIFAKHYQSPFSSPFTVDFPEALQLLVQFPYHAGTQFVLQAVTRGGYQKLDEAYRYPPRSTEEILNRDKSSRGAPDFEIPQPLSALSPNLTVLHSDTLGEFTLRVLLRSLGVPDDHAVNGAKGWGGDLVELRREGGVYNILLRTHWDSFNDAREFMRLFADAQRDRAGGKVNIIGKWGEITPKLSMRVTGRYGAPSPTAVPSSRYPVTVEVRFRETQCS